MHRRLVILLTVIIIIPLICGTAYIIINKKAEEIIQSSISNLPQNINCQISSSRFIPIINQITLNNPSCNIEENGQNLTISTEILTATIKLTDNFEFNSLDNISLNNIKAETNLYQSNITATSLEIPHLLPPITNGTPIEMLRPIIHEAKIYNITYSGENSPIEDFNISELQINLSRIDYAQEITINDLSYNQNQNNFGTIIIQGFNLNNLNNLENTTNLFTDMMAISAENITYNHPIAGTFNIASFSYQNTDPSNAHKDHHNIEITDINYTPNPLLAIILGNKITQFATTNPQNPPYNITIEHQLNTLTGEGYLPINITQGTDNQIELRIKFSQIRREGYNQNRPQDIAGLLNYLKRNIPNNILLTETNTQIRGPLFFNYLTTLADKPTPEETAQFLATQINPNPRTTQTNREAIYAAQEGSQNLSITNQTQAPLNQITTTHPPNLSPLNLIASPIR